MKLSHFNPNVCLIVLSNKKNESVGLWHLVDRTDGATHGSHNKLAI